MSATAVMLGVVTGLALASIYVLIAVSFTLVLAASGVFTFAQGTVVMLGTVLAYIFAVQYGWSAPVVVCVIAAAGVAGGLLTHVIAVLPAIGRSKNFGHTTMLTTIGLGTAANAAVALLFGSDSYRVPSYVSDNPIMLFSVPLRPTYLVMIAIGLAVTAVVDWVIRNTTIGHVFRATLEDPEGAQLLGIDTIKVITSAFALAGAMSAIAGYLIAPVIAASAFTAQELAFFGFAGMAIGGFGSFSGALAGGSIVGLIAGVTPTLANPHLTLPLLWIVCVGVLLVRPGGLFGTAGLFGSARIREV
jgi:branched-subunit amino acid ABC-type transport system permease component